MGVCSPPVYFPAVGEEKRENTDWKKLEAVWLSGIEPIINAQVRKLSHVVFGLQCRHESTTVEHGMKAFVKVHMTFP